MEILKESCVWLTKDLEFHIILTLTQTALSYSHESKPFHLPLSHTIGCQILSDSSQSFKILSFSHKKSKFKTHQFTTSTCQQAQSWCEVIEKTLYSNKPRNICFILNPKSGNCSGQRVFDKEVLPVLSFSPVSYDLFISTYSSFIDELINRRDFSVYTDIICLGGDGTIQQVLNAIQQHSPSLLSTLRFGVLPVGSRNALACELNGKSLNTHIFSLIKGLSIQGDLLKVSINTQSILATCAVSWGVISDAADEAQHLRLFGPFRYNLVAFKRFFTKWKQYSGVISFEDALGQMVSFASDYVFAVIANHQIPNIQNSEILVPDARINDGKVDLMLMFYTSKCRTLCMFRKMLKGGAHVGSPCVNFVKSRKVRIETNGLKVFNVDGEIYYTDAVEVEVMPGAVSYLGGLGFNKQCEECILSTNKV